MMARSWSPAWATIVAGTRQISASGSSETASGSTRASPLLQRDLHEREAGEVGPLAVELGVERVLGFVAELLDHLAQRPVGVDVLRLRGAHRSKYDRQLTPVAQPAEADVIEDTRQMAVQRGELIGEEQYAEDRHHRRRHDHERAEVRLHPAHQP